MVKELEDKDRRRRCRHTMIGLLVLAAFFGVIVIMLFARREGVTMREGDYPSPLPTPAPTVAPTARPQKSAPTATPSVVPSFAPTATPSGKPSPAPSAEPTAAASVATQSGVQRRSADDDATGLDDAFSMSGRGGGNMTVLSADDDDDDDSSGKEWAGSHNATDVWVSAFVVDDEDDDSGAIPKTTKMSLVTKLRVLVRVPGFTSETLTAAVQYAPHNTTLPALWSAATDLVCSEGDAKVELSLFRLRPHTEYTANVYFCAVDGDTRNSSINRCSSSSETWLSSSAASVAEVTFKTGRTGVPRFDDGPLARVERVHAFETPGWDMVTFAYNVDVESSSSSSTPLDNSAGSAARTHFDGVVAIDAEGWVVWYYHLRSTVGWDFLPYASDGTGGGIVLMSDSLKQSLTWKTYDDADDDDDDDSRAASTRHDDALLAVRSTPTTHHWLANSQLQHVTPYGELESQFVQGCTGAALNYNQLSHELRLDHTSADLDGLVIRQVSGRGKDKRRNRRMKVVRPRRRRARESISPLSHSQQLTLCLARPCAECSRVPERDNYVGGLGQNAPHACRRAPWLGRHALATACGFLGRRRQRWRRARTTLRPVRLCRPGHAARRPAEWHLLLDMGDRGMLWKHERRS